MVKIGLKRRINFFFYVIFCVDIYFVRYYNLVILRLKFYEMILVSVFDFSWSKIFMKGEDFMLNKVG